MIKTSFKLTRRLQLVIHIGSSYKVYAKDRSRPGPYTIIAEGLMVHMILSTTGNDPATFTVFDLSSGEVYLFV